MITRYPTYALGDTILTSYPYGVEFDGDHGAPETITELVQTMLSDGDLVRVSKHGNREISLVVQVEGATLGDLNRAEADLREECSKPSNLLTFNPGDIDSETSGFEVLAVSMRQPRDDNAESQLVRRWELTLTCAPFARDTELTAVEAISIDGTASTVTVSSADSTSGWSVLGVGALSAASGYVQSDVVADGPRAHYLAYTDSALHPETPYFIVEYQTSHPTVGQIYSTSGQLIQSVLLPDGWMRSTFDTRLRPGGGTPGLTMPFRVFIEPPVSTSWFRIRDVKRSNRLPESGRQSTRIIDVGGTERTSGSLQVSGSSNLRLTLVATWPETGSGFSPPLRRWRVSGNTQTATADTYSGFTEPIGPSFVQHDIAATSLPVGTYQLMGLLRATSAGSYPLESVIQSRMGGATLGEAPLWSESVSFPLANDWRLVPMGIYRIPIVSANAGEFRISIRCTSSNNVQYDELWLFPVDEDCALTAFVASKPNVWIDSPSLETRVPKFYEGTATDRSDAHWPTNGVFAPGLHTFKPGPMAVFTATGVANPAVSLSYFRRFHSNVAREA